MTARLYSPWGEIPAAGGKAPAGASLASPAGHACAAGDEALLWLTLIAAHHRCDLAGAIAIAAAAYCRDAIGLQRLADLNEQLQGRAEAARLAHNQEVARSNRAPATSFPCDDAIAVAGADLRSGEPPP